MSATIRSGISSARPEPSPASGSIRFSPESRRPRSGPRPGRTGRSSVESHPEALAYEYFGTKVNYRDLLQKVERISGSYHNLGVRKDDIVTVIMPNTRKRS